MSNDYFQFKQFRIEQGSCAMKVTTDACIQGAWTPLAPGIKRILDIGAGTGLLSLMLAQRLPDVIIDSIEFDTDAAKQAIDNVEASPWHDRLNIIEADVRDFPFEHKYDLIISNPPFFNNSLLSDRTDKNLARHTVALTYDALLKVIGSNLSTDGYASILLPQPEYLQWKELLDEDGWSEPGKLFVRHRPSADVKRVVSLCSRTGKQSNEEALIIRNDDAQYTSAFTDLLSPFYLAL